MLSRLLIIIVLSFGLLPNCSSNRILPPNHHSYISFGSVGGFAGKYTENRLLPNGQMFIRTKHKGDFSKQKSLSQNQSKQFYSILKGVYKDQYRINEPGNITYYVKWIDADEQKMELVWGSGATKVDARVLRLYSTLKKMSSDLVYTR